MPQHLQIVPMITGPGLVFVDERVGMLNVPVRERLRDLLREMRLSTVIGIHNPAGAQVLAERLLVMMDGLSVATGLTDQVFDDPQHADTVFCQVRIAGMT